MRDINFFEPYVMKNRGKENKQKIFYGITALSIAAVVSFPVFNLFYVQNMKRDIQHMQTTLEAPEAKEKLQRVEDKQAKLEEIKKVLPIIQNNEKELQKIEILDEQFIQTIMDSIPKDLQFDSLNISDSNVNIAGKARDKSAVAELQYNLRATNKFSDIHVANISFKENEYDFSLQFAVRDVN